MAGSESSRPKSVVNVLNNMVLLSFCWSCVLDLNKGTQLIYA